MLYHLHQVNIIKLHKHNSFSNVLPTFQKRKLHFVMRIKFHEQSVIINISAAQLSFIFFVFSVSKEWLFYSGENLQQQ